MAYITAEAVKAIRDEIKSKFTKANGWTISVQRKDCNSVDVVVVEAPYKMISSDFADVSYSYHESYGISKKACKDIATIKEIVNRNNFDKSDARIDFFCVGYYSHFYIGTYGNPFQVFNKNKSKTPRHKQGDKQEPPFKSTASSIKSVICENIDVPLSDISVRKSSHSMYSYTVVIATTSWKTMQYTFPVTKLFMNTKAKEQHDEIVIKFVNNKILSDNQFINYQLKRKLTMAIQTIGTKS